MSSQRVLSATAVIATGCYLYNTFRPRYYFVITNQGGARRSKIIKVNIIPKSGDIDMMEAFNKIPVEKIAPID